MSQTEKKKIKKVPTGTKKEKKKVEKKVEEKVKEKVEETVEEKVETPVEESTLETSEMKSVLSLSDKKDNITDILSNLLMKFENMEKESRNAKNDVKKVMKLYLKKSFKNKRKFDPNRTPSGFAKPSLISEALCKFLNKPSGTKMARTDVTKEVNNYIKSHNLQNPENKKKITPDLTLKNLLKINDDDTLTYFSMQKYLKDHFPKESTEVST